MAERTGAFEVDRGTGAEPAILGQAVEFETAGPDQPVEEDRKRMGRCRLMGWSAQMQLVGCREEYLE